MAGALAAIPELVSAGISAAPYAIAGGKAAYGIGKDVVRLANHVFSKTNRKSGASYLRRLLKNPGKKLPKLFQRDLPKLAGEISKGVSSGKFRKEFEKQAGRVKAIADASGGLGKTLGSSQMSGLSGQLSSGLASAEKQFDHYHTLAEKYNSSSLTPYEKAKRAYEKKE